MLVYENVLPLLIIHFLLFREKGGAYGSGARQDDGVFAFMSYRY